MRKILITVIIVLVLIFSFIFFGFYNVSARKPDPEFVNWFLAEVSERSIERYSKSQKILILSDKNMQLTIGNKFYYENCAICHGVPDVQRSKIGKGLNPVPPDLEKIQDLNLKEISWIIDNGIKMTGMPSFGNTTNDTTIWACAYFIVNKIRRNPKQGSDGTE